MSFTEQTTAQWMSDELWMRTQVAGCPVGDYVGDRHTQQQIIDDLREQGVHSPYHFNELFQDAVTISPVQTGEQA